MKHLRRNFFKLIGVSFLSTILLPYKFLYAITKKIINPDLTDEQKKNVVGQTALKLFNIE